MTEKTVHSTYSLQRLSFSREKRGFLGHFQVTENARSQELKGVSPPGHFPGLCPGPAGGLTATPDPQLVLAMTIAYVPLFDKDPHYAFPPPPPPNLKSWLHP